MRVPSTRQKTFADGSVGYLHTNDGAPLPLPPKREKTVIPCESWGDMLSAWNKAFQWKGVSELAEKLGVHFQALKSLGCQPSPQPDTFGFPMRNGKGEIVGIRLRNLKGEKWAVPGSHQGLFIPQHEMDGYLYIVEGPTDTAAAASLGVQTIGRPSCNGGMTDVLEFIHQQRIKRVVVIADNDKDRIINERFLPSPGTSGALRLSEMLPVSSCVLTLPCKDMREFLCRGGDWRTLNYLTGQCSWRIPQ